MIARRMPALVPLLLVGMLSACRSGVREQILPAGRLGAVALTLPPTAPTALVFLFSDVPGWDAAYAAAARTLAESGALVVGVDLPQYLRNLAASDDGCHYVVAEIEAMSERLQREYHFAHYASPILAGIGAGGTLAYAGLAQAPAATVGGAVSVDPSASLGTRVPLCPGAPSAPVAGDGFAYGPQAPLHGWWQVSAAGSRSPALATLIDRAHGVRTDVRGDPLARVVSLVRDAIPAAAAGGSASALADLPLVELPATRPGPVLAVIYSGDGGWRDLDKQIGEYLAEHGTPVVGVDSLRYFWKEKTPAEIARDLSRLVRHFDAAWGTQKVALIGYSFGAGILPFALNRLPDEDRARVVQVSLLGLEPRADLEVKVGGWFGSAAGSSAPEVLPEILRQPLGLFQCFYGEDEPDTLCRSPQLAGAEVIGTKGGHHFDGDYRALAQRIIEGIARRTASPGDHAT